MKRQLQIIFGASAASVLAISVLAQDTTNPKTDRPDYNGQRLAHARADRLNATAKAGDVIGMTVKNNQDEKLGKVQDLAVDVECGRIVQVILSTGGFLGIGDTLTAVTPGALRLDAANKIIYLDASKEKLKAAPKFDMSKWDESTQSNRVIEVYSYYGEEPYFIANRDAYRTSNNTQVNRNVELPRHVDGTPSTDGSRAGEIARNTELALNVQETSNTISNRNTDGTWTREPKPNESTVRSSRSSLGYVQKASMLIGTSVKNLQDQKLGKVENFIVDLSAGRIVAVIISAGGFIGIGDELSAVPPTALRFNAAHDGLQLDASKETLASSPHFKANEWPDLSQPAYADGVYRAYKVEPYFTTDATTDPDNTLRNARSRDTGTLTPLDQGNSKADVDTTAQIRKDIIASKGMSVNARNVKIITKNGLVTLRGPVNTAEEKRLIGEIADRVARSENVDNQLEVKLITSSNN